MTRSTKRCIISPTISPSKIDWHVPTVHSKEPNIVHEEVMEKKIKILVVSDHPLAMSGVGNQTRYFIEALLKTGRFSFVCFGGAMRHENYTPQKVDPYGEDWIIYPVDGYGDADKIRSVISSHKPDILWFMTDPRFYEWLWDIENEVRNTLAIPSSTPLISFK